MFDLEIEGQGHGGERLQWSRSMGHINLYKSHTCAFFASSHRFRDIHISKFVILKMYFKVMMLKTSAVAPFDDKNLTFYLITIVMFVFFSLYFSK